VREPAPPPVAPSSRSASTTAAARSWEKGVGADGKEGLVKSSKEEFQAYADLSLDLGGFLFDLRGSFTFPSVDEPAQPAQHAPEVRSAHGRERLWQHRRSLVAGVRDRARVRESWTSDGKLAVTVGGRNKLSVGHAGQDAIERKRVLGRVVIVVPATPPTEVPSEHPNRQRAYPWAQVRKVAIAAGPVGVGPSRGVPTDGDDCGQASQSVVRGQRVQVAGAPSAERNVSAWLGVVSVVGTARQRSCRRPARWPPATLAAAPGRAHRGDENVAQRRRGALPTLRRCSSDLDRR